MMRLALLGAGLITSRFWSAITGGIARTSPRRGAWCRPVRSVRCSRTASVSLRFASGALGSFVISDCVVSPWSSEFTSGQALYFPHQPGAHPFLGGSAASLSVSDMKLWRHARPGADWRDPVAASMFKSLASPLPTWTG